MDLLEHTPATEPIPLVVLEVKAAEYLQKRRLGRSAVNRADVVVSKSGREVELASPLEPQRQELQGNQMLVDVTRDNRQAYCKGYHLSLPSTFTDRQFIRTISEKEFILSDPETAEVAFSFPLPKIALKVHGKYVASCSIKGVQLANQTAQWQKKVDEYLEQHETRQQQMPDVFDYR